MSPELSLAPEPEQSQEPLDNSSQGTSDTFHFTNQRCCFDSRFANKTAPMDPLLPKVHLVVLKVGAK